MAFPTIPTGTRILRQNQNDTTQTRTFPSLSGLTKSAGDLLVAIVVAYERSAASATFSGWTGGFTELTDVDGGATTMAVGIATKTSTGSETGTFAVTQATTVTGHVSLYVMSIPGWHGTTLPEVTALAVGTGAAADAAALSPSWGAADTLWICVGGSGETNAGGSWTGIGGLPTNYTDTVTITGSDVVGGITTFVGFRQNNTASEDVGPFSTVDITNARNCALTIAVRPSGVSTQNIGPATGVTVTVTPGTGTVTPDQAIANVSGPTVTATPGIAAVIPDQQIAGVTGVTVTVTPGTGIIGQVVEASAFLGLTDTAGDFDTMTTLEADLYIEEDGTATDDSLDLYVQVFAADETTPLTDEELAYSHGDTPGLVPVTFSGVAAGDKTTWDGARLRLRWSNLIVGTDDVLDVLVHAVEISGTYATAGLTVGPATGPTVTVTPGTPQLALAVTPTGVTVTVTPGVPAFSRTIAPAGVTVTVTPGTPAFQLAVGPATGPTVTVTPGTGTVTPGTVTIPATGPTVTVTPGTGNVSLLGGLQSFTADGPTVTITPGTPAFALHVTPSGVTVTTTPGTAAVGPPSPRPTGPTVTVTAGTPAFARTIGPATGVTVTVTPGVPAFARTISNVVGPTVTVTPGTGAVSVAGGAQNVLPAGVTVTVTPGLPQLVYGQSFTATGVTVTVTPGVGTVIRAQALAPIGPTVTVTPGLPTVSGGVLATGVTVTVTPGLPTVGASQTIPATGVTVTVTPGVPLFAGVQPVTVTGPTVTVTPGAPAVMRDPYGDKVRYVATLDFTEPVGEAFLVGTRRPPHLTETDPDSQLVGATAPHLDRWPELDQ